MSEEKRCGGVAGCGHPAEEHKRIAGDSKTACTHKLSKGGRDITCSCRRFKGVRTRSSVSKRQPEVVNG